MAGRFLTFRREKMCIRDSNGDLWVGSNKGLFRRKAGGRTFDCEKNMDIKSVIEDLSLIHI